MQTQTSPRRCNSGIGLNQLCTKKLGTKDLSVYMCHRKAFYQYDFFRLTSSFLLSSSSSLSSSSFLLCNCCICLLLNFYFSVGHDRHQFSPVLPHLLPHRHGQAQGVPLFRLKFKSSLPNQYIVSVFMFNRPGVAGAVLQTALSLID